MAKAKVVVGATGKEMRIQIANRLYKLSLDRIIEPNLLGMYLNIYEVRLLKD
jgi:hypothetical protein